MISVICINTTLLGSAKYLSLLHFEKQHLWKTEQEKKRVETFLGFCFFFKLPMIGPLNKNAKTKEKEKEKKEEEEEEEEGGGGGEEVRAYVF